MKDFSFLQVILWEPIILEFTFGGQPISNEYE